MANEKQMDSELIEELQQRLEALNNEGVMDAGVIDGFLTAYALNPEHPSKHDIYPTSSARKAIPPPCPKTTASSSCSTFASTKSRPRWPPRAVLIRSSSRSSTTTTRSSPTKRASKPRTLGLRLLLRHDALARGLIADDEINSLATPIIRNISPDDFETPEEAEQFVQEYRSGEMPKNLEDALYDLVKAVFDLKQLVDPNKPVVREEPRVGRNDPCPCGSSKKFKQCCGKK